MNVILIIIMLLMPFPLYIAFQALFINQRYQKGIRAVEEAYQRMIKSHHLTNLEVNRFINRLIAIDREKGKLILIVYKKGITWETCVLLQEISYCHTINSYDHISNYIQKVNLELVIRNNPSIVSFPFFEEELDDVRDLKHRTRKCEYWQQKILYYANIPPSGQKLDHTPLGKQ